MPRWKLRQLQLLDNSGRENRHNQLEICSQVQYCYKAGVGRVLQLKPISVHRGVTIISAWIFFKQQP